MDKKEAKSLLKNLTRDCIIITEHCKQRMRERDVVIDDILYVIMWGEVSDIEEDPEHNNWKCYVKGKDIEGDDLTVIAGINEAEGYISCITVC